MKTLPIGRYRFFQRLQPLSILTKITSQSATGCLQVFSPSASWSIYLEQGKLIYVCYSDNMFDLLYRKLQQWSQQIPTLHNGIYQQLRVLFETSIDERAIPNPDYLAICWLVKQRYLNSQQAGRLIQELAIEVLQSFLAVDQGSYEFTTESFLDNMPHFCRLDVHLLVEQCQKKTNKAQDSQYGHKNQPQSKTKPKQRFSKENVQGLHPDFNESDNNNQKNYQQPVDKKLYKIVCIDDSPIVLTIIKSFLDEQIFSVIGFNEPLKALMQIIRTKPDLILLDIEMPNLDGYELCSLLRKHSYFKNTPVIMVTARRGFIDRAKAKLVRASGYLTKPFSQSELMKIIFQFML